MSTEEDHARDILPRSALRARTIVIGLVLGIPLSVLFLWLAIRGVDLGEVWDALRSANTGYVLMAVPVMLSVLAFQGLRWRALLGDDAPLDRRTYMALAFFGNGVSNVVPGRPGDVVRGVWLSRLSGLPVARGLASVVVDRAFDVISLVVILLACLPFVPHPTWLRNLALIGGLVAAALLIVLVLAWWYSHRSAHGRAWLDAPEQKSWIKRQAAGVVRGMATMSHTWQVAEVVGWSMAVWAAWTAGALLISQSLGLGLNPGQALFVCGVIGLGAAIPSAPGMIGTLQWLAVTVLAVLGIGKVDALAFSVILQMVIFIPVSFASPAIAWWLVVRRPRTHAPPAAAAVPASPQG